MDYSRSTAQYRQTTGKSQNQNKQKKDDSDEFMRLVRCLLQQDRSLFG
jgi:flagellar hook assembly protein FlgD